MEPRTVDEVFTDFKRRRTGLMKALTTDVDKFYEQCDPEKDNLCLYGLPNETWEVNLPAEEVPPELPEPALGINFARDGMHGKDWLSLVAAHGDSWLLAVAFYFAARFGFAKNESLNPCPRPREKRQLPRLKKMMRVGRKEKKMAMNRGPHYVVFVGKTMPIMNFGYVVISVKNGSMANV